MASVEQEEIEGGGGCARQRTPQHADGKTGVRLKQQSSNETQSSNGSDEKTCRSSKREIDGEKAGKKTTPAGLVIFCYL